MEGNELGHDWNKAAYENTIISSFSLVATEPVGIAVPPDALFMVFEGRQVTFYRSKSRPDLSEVPEWMRGKSVQFNPVDDDGYSFRGYK